MLHYCTYFDSLYLPRGLAMYRSLRAQRKDIQLWVLALDDNCRTTLEHLRLPGVEIIPLEVLEAGDQELVKRKPTRSRIEYYFTCTPVLFCHILENRTEVDLLTYLDADLFFYADPAPLFEEMSQSSVAITPHRFTQALKHLEQYGSYNVGWVSFRRDERALACLKEWRSQCLEWCYDRVEDGKFADQKYLDSWPVAHEGVVSLSHPGANVAPWNVSGLRLEADREGRVTVDEVPLLFYHFHGLRRVWPGVYDPRISQVSGALPRILRNRVYVPYIKAVRDAAEACGWQSGADPFANSSRPSSIRRAPQFLVAARQLLRRRYVVPLVDR